MSAPDFYFAIQAIFRHLHDCQGKEVLIDYWRALAREYYADRTASWKAGGLPAVAADWRSYFDAEPGADVQVTADDREVVLAINVCPAIKHLRAHHRDIVPYFCEHCDHICGMMAEAADLEFRRDGGMGACCQRFIRRPAPASETA
jgi:hypothetical protein